MPKVSRDPSVCLACWNLWLEQGAKPRRMPKPLERRDTWQERVEWKNMGDQSSRLAVVEMARYCREHGMERVRLYQGDLENGTQEALL